MNQFHIAVYPGDGIGVDVTNEAVRVVEAAQAKLATFQLKLTPLPWGANFHAQTGRVAPPDFLETLRRFDAILLGALGWPAKLPDHVTLEPLVQIRQRFDQYACVRPARLLPGVRSPLADKKPGDIDLVVVRENSEGEYVRVGGRVRRAHPEEVTIESAVHTRRGVERVLRFGFELARTRRRTLTMITKSNAMKYSMVMWDEVLEELQPQYRDVASDRQHVDAATMNFVRCPERFDVVVASNLFGDILTDLGGVIAGGLGLAPSANINPERAFPSMFEPVHGSAPDITGKGVANPVAAILSAALMLDWLKQEHAAMVIRRAVEEALRDGQGTPDLGGQLTTAQLGGAIIERLRA